MTNVKFKPWMGIVGGIVGLFVLFLIITVASFSSTKSQAVTYEQQVQAEYDDAQNYLSAYIAGFYEQTGVAKVKSDKLEQVLLAAVKGRYEKGSSAAPANGQLISAITEAYPDLKGLDSYDRIIDYIQGGREGYRNKQSKLRDVIRVYDTWRDQGFIRPMKLSVLGFPSDRLKAKAESDGSGVTLTGEAALDRMRQLIIVEQADTAYRTGRDQALEIPAE